MQVKYNQHLAQLPYNAGWAKGWLYFAGGLCTQQKLAQKLCD